MSDHFKVYRVADAPQEYCDFGRLCRDDDPIIVVEKGGDAPQDLQLDLFAEHVMLLLVRGNNLRGAIRYKRDETATHIIYTVDRS